eukprot:TRINITY_DN7094_c0_g3_i1.p1 TRINITY_DN7094_c0_g3~~TRINITY_DN7094_c0_g3_i1.p1  ORF type:complete len:437 (+),score=56.28 TRINITY_DN7094_c0_g3_i1:72-1382(+)
MMVVSVLALSVSGADPAMGALPTPPMGWMSWERFWCNADCNKFGDMCLTQKLFHDQADLLVSLGLRDVGYDTIHVDDCTYNENPSRDAEGYLVANKTTFPDGYAGLGTYFHSKGLKFGFYGAMSPNTCAGYPSGSWGPQNPDGTWGHIQTEVDSYQAWGVDYIKMDGCNGAYHCAKNDTPTQSYQVGYVAMGHALQAAAKKANLTKIAYSCSWPVYLQTPTGGMCPETDKEVNHQVYSAMIEAGCNVYRNTWDIYDVYWNVANTIEYYGVWGEYLARWAGPGHWNDPDMLLIGNPSMTTTESQTQLAIWSILAGPLIMGNDLRNLTEGSLEVLLNKDAIAVNQDPLGKAGWRLRKGGQYNTSQVWFRTLQDGYAAALYNSHDHLPADVTFDFAMANLTAATYAFFDIWNGTSIGAQHTNFTRTVAPHGTLFYKLTV